MLHFSLESRHVGGDSKFSHFFLFLDKILVLLFIFVFRRLRAGRGPCFQFFRARFARVAVEVDAPRSSSDEPVSADLRI
jgi:hypothetical protein